MNTHECSAYCKPSEGIHSEVVYVSTSTLDRPEGPVLWSAVQMHFCQSKWDAEVLEVSYAPEAPEVDMSGYLKTQFADNVEVATWPFLVTVRCEENP